MTDSAGDPRVLFVMNLVLSATFAWLVVRGLAVLGVLTFAWRTVGLATAVLMLLTYLVVR
ncbi:hypothetical protein BRC82_09140 [Halobacteriales archaeon QS_1_67_19]|nr:MAG: hypothetical protein BRC82_09140 [Halobacteriales archaeon QS_1_67_19]